LLDRQRDLFLETSTLESAEVEDWAATRRNYENCRSGYYLSLHDRRLLASWFAVTYGGFFGPKIFVAIAFLGHCGTWLARCGSG
jgi:hypothetical protein